MPWTLGSEIHVDNLHARENVHIDGDPITLSALAEPLLGSDHGIGVGSMHFDPGCSYKTGHLTLSNAKGVDTLQTTILPVGGEDLNASNAFDTIVMLNVLEHTFDALRVLSNTHRALRPGGALVFMDTVYSDYEGTEYAEWLREMARTRKQPPYWNWQLHPIRLRPAIIEEWLDLGFNKPALFGPQWFKGRPSLHKEVVALIATKK